MKNPSVSVQFQKMSNKLNGYLLITFLSIFLFSCTQSTADFSNRELNFDSDWKFYRGTISGAEIAAFNDSQWRNLDLPHDWSIEDLPAAAGKKQIGPFTEDSEGKGSTGHTVGGVGWYRKTFNTESSFKNKIVQVNFDGVYMESNVWINGQHLGFHGYGYTPFTYDLTPYLKSTGEKNTLAVWVNNPGKNSRWYSGSGIYRHVKLQVTGLVNIPVCGTFISTPEVSAGKATVKVVTKVDNSTSEAIDVTISTSILSPEGIQVAQIESSPENQFRKNC